MAIIKCPTCGKSVSDSDVKCPHCDNLVDNKIHCPKCKSSNTELNIKSNGTVKTSLIYSLFGAFAGRAAEKEKIRYVCKDCGKTFKLK